MANGLQAVNSFCLEIDDWHSCHTSDDEAYQEALERNSSASFYTARGPGSSAASSVYASVALGRMADVDEALEEMVPESLSDARLQHEHPELDELETPASKRTRSLPQAPLPMVTSVVTALPVRPKPMTRPVVRRDASSPTSSDRTPENPPVLDGASRPAALGTSDQPAVRVCISMLPDGSSVQLHVSPAVFCFGNVSFPVPTAVTDYSAVLLGPDGGLHAEDSGLAYGEPQPSPKLGPDAPAVADAEADTLVESERRLLSRHWLKDSSLFSDPSTPKDQTKTKRSVEAKEHKPTAGFLGSSIIQRLISSFRSSWGGADPQSLPPITAQELGSQLLLSSAGSGPRGLALAIAAAQQTPIIAGYVQAAAPNPAPAGGGGGAQQDEATTAAQRLSADIFRSVLRASAGGADDARTGSPKALRSPRDTTFPPAETQTPQRDQVRFTAAPSAGGHSPLAASARHTPRSHSTSPQAPGQAALALLVGLAADAVPSEAGAGPSGVDALLPAASGEGLDGSDLPMPALEQCDSPVTSKAAAAASDAALLSGSPAAAPVQLPEVRPPAPSPRTVSKRAYITVARLVKKMNPKFNDSAINSVSVSESSSSPLRSAVAAAAAAKPATSPFPAASGGAPAAVGFVPFVAAPAAAAGDGTLGQPGSAPAVLVPSDGAKAPSMFVFGQERPKAGKHTAGKARTPAVKVPGTAAEERDAPVETPGRKRKADLEVLHIAKMALVREDDRAVAGQPGVASPLESTMAAPAGSASVTQAAGSEAAGTSGVCAATAGTQKQGFDSPRDAVEQGAGTTNCTPPPAPSTTADACALTADGDGQPVAPVIVASPSHFAEVVAQEPLSTAEPPSSSAPTADRAQTPVGGNAAVGDESASGPVEQPAPRAAATASCSARAPAASGEKSEAAAHGQASNTVDAATAASGGQAPASTCGDAQEAEVKAEAIVVEMKLAAKDSGIDSTVESASASAGKSSVLGGPTVTVDGLAAGGAAPKPGPAAARAPAVS